MDLEKIKIVAAEMSSDQVNLAIAAGVIPESASEAYRLGYERGIAATQGAVGGGSVCWFCLRPRQPPNLDDQVRQLAALHYERSSIYHFAPQEFQALREHFLRDGDLLAAVKTGQVFYGTVRIFRGGQTVDILRRQLQEHARQES